MDYGAEAKSVGGEARRSPELGKLKAASERVAKCSAIVEDFNRKFFGQTPEGGDDTADAQNDSYRNDIENLFKVVGRLKYAIAQLPNIG